MRLSHLAPTLLALTLVTACTPSDSPTAPVDSYSVHRMSASASANQAPTASFTPGCAGLACDFQDTSTDADGSVVAWAWDFGDGGTSTLQHPSHTYAAAGDFPVTLTATDDAGASDTLQMQVSAVVTNQAPTASFTWACTDLSCAFTNTSTDADGTVVSSFWRFGDGWSANGHSPGHVYADYGVYTVSLTVTDDDRASSTVSMDVTVEPPGTPPTASFTSSCVGLACDFVDTSTEGSEAITAWSWAFGDGTTSTARHPSHAFSADGTYSVSLTVADGSGRSHTADMDVTVAELNQAPTASFSSVCADLTCAFTDASTDGDGAVVSWMWDFGDGATATQQHPSHAYGGPGTYVVTLTVMDDDGASDLFSASVTAVAPLQAPDASFTSSCAGLTCDFTDSSTDGDGTVVSWAWTFGDGAMSSDQHPSHTYTAAGTYTVGLTATDDDGMTDAFSATVTVTAPNEGPVAKFDAKCAALSCVFTDASSDADGSVVAWSWSFGDGATSDETSPSHSYATAGSYTVALTVTDDQGASDTTSETVHVSEPTVGITLTAVGRWVGDDRVVDLEWTGATSDKIDVYWSGWLAKTVANDGHDPQELSPNHPGGYVFKVCEAGTKICSPGVTAKW